MLTGEALPVVRRKKACGSQGSPTNTTFLPDSFPNLVQAAHPNRPCLIGPKTSVHSKRCCIPKCLGAPSKCSRLPRILIRTNACLEVSNLRVSLTLRWDSENQINKQVRAVSRSDVRAVRCR